VEKDWVVRTIDIEGGGETCDPGFALRFDDKKLRGCVWYTEASEESVH